MLILSPAYGRDYKSAKAVKEAWANDYDFVGNPGGWYINRSDAVKRGVKKVQIRYSGLRKVVVLDVR